MTNKGKVVILGGTPRSGKTTLALMLARRGFSKLSFDIFNEAIEKGLPEVVIEDNHDQESCARKLYPFFETIVGGAVDEARRFGLNTVIDMYDYTPEYVSRLPYLADVDVFFLAYPDFDVAEIRTNIRQYAQPEDWIAQVDEEYLTVVAERCDRVNQKLVRQCAEYGFRLVNTGAGGDRDRVLDQLCREIAGE
jgi:hypothetical protein